jgi:hypothetical protein
MEACWTMDGGKVQPLIIPTTSTQDKVAAQGRKRGLEHNQQGEKIEMGIRNELNSEQGEER